MAASAIQATISKTGFTDVDILMTSSIEHGFDKQLAIKPLPEQTPVKTLLVDLKRLREAITVVGILEDTAAKSGLEKKNDLRSMLLTKKIMTIAWGAAAEQSYDGIVSKCIIKELSGRVGHGGSETRTFEINLTFIVGSYQG